MLVVDARRLYGDALAGQLATCPQVDAVGWAAPADADRLIEDRQPDIVLLAVPPAPEAAAMILPWVRAARRGGQVVVLADRLDRGLVALVLEQGLGGLLLSDGPVSELADCLASVARGHCVLPDGWQAALDPGEPDPRRELSARQAEVLDLLAEGCAYEEIATRLGISLNTVKFHTRSIFRRLGVRNRVAAVHRLGMGT